MTYEGAPVPAATYSPQSSGIQICDALRVLALISASKETHQVHAVHLEILMDNEGFSKVSDGKTVLEEKCGDRKLPKTMAVSDLPRLW